MSTQLIERTEVRSPMIHLTEVSKTFRTPDGFMTAVDGIDLTVAHGEVLALLGPNGAGKTTTIDMVLGLTQPSSGTIEVLGDSPRSAVLAGRVSAVLQTGGLLADLRTRETVRLIASTFDSPCDVDEVMERAGILHLADRRVSKLSGGEQQRLRFALALIPEPDLLILDEPTAGMDVGARREFWSTMHCEAARGRTVIFATHYLEEAEEFADRIVMMSEGRIVADGPTSEVRAVANGRTVTVELPLASLDDTLARLRSHPAVTAVEPAGGLSRFRIRSTDSDAVARAVLTELGGTDLEVTAGSLDDAFLTLTHSRTSAPVLEGAAR
ncbi:MAG: ABC transporter ATP-binding protein [Dermatophilaceae bacterium]